MHMHRQWGFFFCWPESLQKSGPKLWLVLSSFLMVSLLGLSGCHGPLASLAPWGEASSSGQQAQQLYQQAWASLRADYVDGSFNGQHWLYWQTRYNGKLHTLEDAYVAIDTMIESLGDDYTRLLRPRAFGHQSRDIDAQLAGVGLHIALRQGQLTVISPIVGTPAQRAGLRAGDRITHINGWSTAGHSAEECAERIRGKEGLALTLTITRGRAKKPQVYRLVRALIHVPSVYTQPLLEPQLLKGLPIAYIRLDSFISEDAAQEMAQALADLKRQSPTPEGLILDLRGNYGGLLSNAVDIADLFLDHDLVVSVEGREAWEREPFWANDGQDFTGPMVLLVDGGTASASEILSGALQENHRAKLVGTQTFGKGMVQKIMPLQQGAGLNITTARYFTPRHRDINHKGIAPDVSVALEEKAFRRKQDTQLEKAVALLKPQLTRPPVLASKASL